jgi:hypothetical protein
VFLSIARDYDPNVPLESAEGSEASRYSSSAAKFGALQDRLASSLRGPSEPSIGTTFSMGHGMSGAEELLALQPPVDVDASAEVSGDTARMFRHIDRESSTSTPPIASSTPMRTLQIPSHFQSQSSKWRQDLAAVTYIYAYFLPLTNMLQICLKKTQTCGM